MVIWGPGYKPPKMEMPQDLIKAEDIEGEGPVLLFGPFSGVDHHLDFITNDEINRLLFAHYRHWYCVFDTADRMKAELQNYVNELGDYWQKRWEAYQLEFNPLYNVDATIETCRKGEQTAHETGSSSEKNYNNSQTKDNSSTKNNEFGYNETTPTQTASSSGTDDTTVNAAGGSEGSSAADRRMRNRECESVRRYGNIGVTSSVTLAREYEDLWLQSVVADYIDSFAKFFILF